MKKIFIIIALALAALSLILIATPQPRLDIEGLEDKRFEEQEKEAPPLRELGPELDPDPEPEPAVREMTLVAVGDLMAHIDQSWDAALPGGGYDFNHSFAEVKADLTEGFAIGNLETVFGGPEIGPMNYPRFNTPDQYGYALFNNGFDFVSTCNNHSLDQFEPGLLRTKRILDEIGLLYTGTYASREESEQITIVEYEGFRIAILAFTFSTNGIPVPQGREYLVNMLTESKLTGDLAKARALAPDLIVVLPHMGNEYEEYTRDVFLGWMDKALYHGADLVLASHPHVLQPMLMRELTDIDGVTRKGFIMPSLGNFISCQFTEPREISVILKIDISQTADERPVIEQVRFVPTWVQYRLSTGQIRIRVLPVWDALQSRGDPENPFGLTPENIDRLFRANSHVTNMMLGEARDGDRMAREYVFYKRPA
jgi:poly-gamma-glutamate synthesis protein (capsule biosynthesis protein)